MTTVQRPRRPAATGPWRTARTPGSRGSSRPARRSTDARTGHCHYLGGAVSGVDGRAPRGRRARRARRRRHQGDGERRDADAGHRRRTAPQFSDAELRGLRRGGRTGPGCGCWRTRMRSAASGRPSAPGWTASSTSPASPRPVWSRPTTCWLDVVSAGHHGRPDPRHRCQPIAAAGQDGAGHQGGAGAARAGLRDLSGDQDRARRGGCVSTASSVVTGTDAGAAPPKRHGARLAGRARARRPPATRSRAPLPPQPPAPRTTSAWGT